MKINKCISLFYTIIKLNKNNNTELYYIIKKRIINNIDLLYIIIEY